MHFGSEYIYFHFHQIRLSTLKSLIASHDAAKDFKTCTHELFCILRHCKNHCNKEWYINMCIIFCRMFGDVTDKALEIFMDSYHCLIQPLAYFELIHAKGRKSDIKSKMYKFAESNGVHLIREVKLCPYGSLEGPRDIEHVRNFYLGSQSNSFDANNYKPFRTILIDYFRELLKCKLFKDK